MNRKSFLFGLIIIFFCNFIVAQKTEFEGIESIIPDNDEKWQKSLNGTWKFMLNGPEKEFYTETFNDTGWQEIKVPSNWEMQGFEEPYYGEPTNSTGLYRKIFEIPSTWTDRQIWIRFEGVLFGYECWVDGKSVGSFESAFNRSQFEISKFLDPEKSEHTIAVRVYKRYKGYKFDTHDDWAISGIYRDVSLFSVPNAQINDISLSNEFFENYSEADISSSVSLVGLDKTKDYSINVILKSSEGEIVSNNTQQIITDATETKLIKNTIRIKNPNLWSAETPYLYKIELSLIENGVTIHRIEDSHGFREISIDGYLLKLNGVAIKLRGVNRHEIHPEVGRALRYEHWKKDLDLMKKANINTIRTSHYPSHPDFIKLCDKMGFYVIEEVPFGFGDDDLHDSSFQETLIKRAKATILRDKNRASVIIWSIGNENPYTAIVDSTARYVKSIDERPILVPFAKGGRDNMPSYIDIIAPHYPHLDSVKNGVTRRPLIRAMGKDATINRPIIVTEYTHAMGGAFEGLEKMWEIAEDSDRVAGGCVWHWMNQGIIRKVNGKEVIDPLEDMVSSKRNPDRLISDFWIDDNTIIDSHGQSGSDGILYANRDPQPDYWLTRNVYSFVKIVEKELDIKSGLNTLSLTFLNRYDFTNLNEISSKWVLLENGNTIQEGVLNLSIKPHEQGLVQLTINIPEGANKNDYLLELTFKDKNNIPTYEHSVRLISSENPMSVWIDQKPRSTPKIKNKKGDIKISNDYLSLHINKETGKIILLNEDKDTLINSFPLLRVGRKPTMTEIRQYKDLMKWEFWESSVLQPTQLIDFKTIKVGKSKEVQLTYNYQRLDKTDENILCAINIIFNDEGGD